jgi:hypothetical protein
MNRLTVIAMAEELGHGLAGEYHFDGAARTLNYGAHHESLWKFCAA